MDADADIALSDACEGARRGIEEERRDHERSWDRLQGLMYRCAAAVDEGRLLEALAAVKEAEDLEFELTADCDWSGALETLLCSALGIWEDDVHQAWESARPMRRASVRCGAIDAIGCAARCVLDRGHRGAHTGAHWVECSRSGRCAWRRSMGRLGERHTSGRGSR